MKSGAKVDENEEGRGNIRAIVELKVEVADLTSSSPTAVKKQTQEMSDKERERQNDLKRLGSSERAHNMGIDLPAAHHNPPMEHPTDTSTKLDHSVLGIATADCWTLPLQKEALPSENSVPDHRWSWRLSSRPFQTPTRIGVIDQQLHTDT